MTGLSKQKKIFLFEHFSLWNRSALLSLSKEFFFIVWSVINLDFHIRFLLSEEVHKSTLKHPS